MKTPRGLRLNAEDNVVIAVDEIKAGEAPAGAPEANERVPRGHKMASVRIETGEPIRKFGQIIGFASKPIEPGQWVHEHNCIVHDFARDYQFCRGRAGGEHPAVSRNRRRSRAIAAPTARPARAIISAS